MSSADCWSFSRDPEPGHDQQEDEQVVDRQRVLGQPAGEVLAGELAARLVVGEPPDAQTEEHSGAHVADQRDGDLLGGGHVRAAGDDEHVEGQRGGHQADGEVPDPGRDFHSGRGGRNESCHRGWFLPVTVRGRRSLPPHGGADRVPGLYAAWLGQRRGFGRDDEDTAWGYSPPMPQAYGSTAIPPNPTTWRNAGRRAPVAERALGGPLRPGQLGDDLLVGGVDGLEDLGVRDGAPEAQRVPARATEVRHLAGVVRVLP